MRLLVKGGLDPYRKRIVVVHTLDGNSLQGVLVGAYDDCVVIRHASDIEAKVELKGDVIVLRSNVSYLQALEAE